MTEITDQDEHEAIWRRLDMPGHEAVRIYGDADGWYLDGAAIFLFEGKACRLEYMIECDPGWQTTFVSVDGFVGPDVIAVEIEVDDDSNWYLNGQEIAAVRGCIDVDLNFSPVTNLLPIKRTALDIGSSVDARAAWLRFPSFELETLAQTYTRKSDSIYTYRSSTGFETDIKVDMFGAVREYPGFWIGEGG